MTESCILGEALGYDDVMLIPKYSEVKSRSDVSVSVKLVKGINVNCPIVPSNMKTIISPDMIKVMYHHKIMCILHRFMTIEDQIKIGEDMRDLYGSDIFKYLGYSIGVKQEDYDNLEKIVDLGVKIICIDIAHGHSKHCIDMIKFISGRYPNVLLIAGNTATYEGAMELYESGADIVKCNVGSGSICLTRINTGNGVPAITTLIDCSRARRDFYARKNKKVFLMTDGGVKSPGDLVKGLCFADLAMCGNVFAGCLEAPGETLKIDGKEYKSYAGSSTNRADGSHVEGVQALVAIKDSAAKIIQRMTDGLKSGMSYQGCFDIKDMQDDPKFVKITNAGMIESGSHNLEKII
jgi:IMP dehydrogenase